MTLYNVDFFDRKMNYVHHDTVEVPDIDMDYLSPDTSEITILQTNDIPAKGIIYIEEMDGFLGIIENVQQGEGETTVSFKPFVSIFDQSVRFYTKSQKSDSASNSLEQTIGGLINSYFGKDTGDELQKLPITVQATSETINWDFCVKPDVEKVYYCVCNLYSVLMYQAITKYRVAVTAKANPNEKTITVTIGASPAKHIIEANMAGVDVVEFTIDQLESDDNKLEIWNSSNFTSKKNYYLYKDGTYDTSPTVKGKERVEPVKMEVMAVNASSSSDFTNKAKEQAEQRFGDLKWKNYIELDVLPDNDTVLTWQDENGVSHPLELGQQVQIYYNGQFYDTILTGMRYSDVTTLMFGRIRTSLSKKNKLKTRQEYIDAKTVTKNSYTSKK